jgi:hypothetical protein
MSNNEIKIPQYYLCPITQEIMTDPVVFADGQTYQRESILAWLARGNTRSPIDGTKLQHTILIDNNIAKKMIIEFLCKSPEEIQQRNNKSNLEKCIRQKEEMIKTLIENGKIDINEINGATTDVLDEIKKKNAALKKQQEELNLQLKQMTKKNHLITTENIDFTKVNFKKSCSSKLDNIFTILELNNGSIACWSHEKIDILNFKKNSLELELTKTYPQGSGVYLIPPIQQCNENIIYVSWSDLTICDKEFNLIENFEENDFISSLCYISELSFAIGLKNGIIKIYSRNLDNKKYEITKEYKYHSSGVYSLLYLPKQNYLA